MRTIAPERLRRSLRAALLILSATALSALTALSTLATLSLLAGCEAPRGTIGAVIAQDDRSGRLFVHDVPPGLAADKAGLERGDEILLIDGLDVRPMTPKQIHAALSGDVDATVKLTLVRSDPMIVRVTPETQARGRRAVSRWYRGSSCVRMHQRKCLKNGGP